MLKTRACEWNLRDRIFSVGDVESWGVLESRLESLLESRISNTRLPEGIALGDLVTFKMH